jgi:hypothetical protein
MVRKTTRRGKRVLIIDFKYTKPDGTEGRYRRDATVQTTAAAQTEEVSRKMGATLFGDPNILCGPNGVPLRPCEPVPEPRKEPTFREVVDRFLTEYAPSAMSPSTRDGYESKLRNHLLPRLGGLVASQAFEVARSREVDVVLVENGVSISTRANVFHALRSVARFAVEAKILSEEPKFLPLPKRGRRVPSAPSAADIAAAIEAARHPERRLVILLAAHAGVHQGAREERSAQARRPEQSRRARRALRSTRHLRRLRARLIGRSRSSGNRVETPPKAARATVR